MIGAAAPNLAVLIVARVVLGFGTCAGYPAAMRLIRAEAERTGKDSPASVLTILAISTQTIAVIGPLLGGRRSVSVDGAPRWRSTSPCQQWRACSVGDASPKTNPVKVPATRVPASSIWTS